MIQIEVQVLLAVCFCLLLLDFYEKLNTIIGSPDEHPKRPLDELYEAVLTCEKRGIPYRCEYNNGEVVNVIPLQK